MATNKDQPRTFETVRFETRLREINWPSPANTTASGESGGRYAVTCRRPSYSNSSVTNSPAKVIVDTSWQ